MRRVLVSLMCHPERTPQVVIPEGDGYEVFVNRTPNYADAYRFAIAKAVSSGMDLVTADTDGYHPEEEILKLTRGSFYGDEPALVIPFRDNLGIQSKAFSLFYSLMKRRRVRDTTSGLCRLSHALMAELPPLASVDMTVHIEILSFAIRTRAQIPQYSYTSGPNDRAGSKRTTNYQWKLFRAAFS
jgi:hypothetical protein